MSPSASRTMIQRRVAPVCEALARTRQPQRRCISTAQSSSRRPAAPVPRSQNEQTTRRTAPWIAQRRTAYKSVEKEKARWKIGPFSWQAALLFVGTAGGLVWYFQQEKERMKRKRIAESTKGYGRAKVGGPFELKDQEGRTVTDGDLKGRYSLIYFGFTHCPDICPEELDKMAAMYNQVEAKNPGLLNAVFITCDPARDGPKELKQYLLEFHPKFLGLTGTYDQIKEMCKVYRVYFSTPPVVKPGQDYLVDHSVYFYLMDPEGDFVEALGRQHSPDAAAKIILDHMGDWKGEFKRKQD